jgi:hypothetical protein
MSDWVRHKLTWLEGVAQDQSLSRLALRIAILMVTRYMNAKWRLAWPSAAKLADVLSAHPRNIQRAIEELVNAGWLSKSPGARGRANRYRLGTPLGYGASDVDVSSAVRRQRRWGYGASDVSGNVTGAVLTQEPGKQPGNKRGHKGHAPSPGDDLQEERQAGETSSKSSSGVSSQSSSRVSSSQRVHSSSQQNRGSSSNHGSSRSSRDPNIPFPPDWKFGPAELKVAREIAGWDPVHAEHEFNRFRDRHVAKGTLFRSWSAAWSKWCRDGLDFDRKHPSPRETGFGSALDGLDQWVGDQTDGDDE